jgi:uncharacterized membrane protein (UPF0127 family)
MRRACDDAPVSSPNRHVRVENVTRGTTLAESCRVAKGLRQRIFGLHLLPQLREGEGLLLPGANSIDTTFMRYDMDAVFMDGQHRVTKVVHAMKPWRIVPLARGAKDCIELPAGAATASGTAVGDELRLVDL